MTFERVTLAGVVVCSVSEAAVLLETVAAEEPVLTCLLAVVPLAADPLEVLLLVEEEVVLLLAVEVLLLVPEEVVVLFLLSVLVLLEAVPVLLEVEVLPVERFTWLEEEVLGREAVVPELREALVEVLLEAVLEEVLLDGDAVVVLDDLLSEEFVDLLVVVVLRVWAVSSDDAAAREKARTLTRAIL